MPAHIDWTFMTLLTTAATRSGADLEGTLQRLGIGVQSAQQAAPLPIATLAALFSELSDSSQKCHFPFAFAEIFHFDGLPMVSTFLASATSLREAKRLFDWLPMLVHPSIEVQPIETGERAELTIRINDSEGIATDSPALVEIIAAIVFNIGRQIAPDHQLLAAQFKHEALTAPEHYAQFFECPVHFGEPRNALMIRSELLDATRDNALAGAHAMAEAAIREKIYGGSITPSLTMQVQDLIQQQPQLLGERMEVIAQALRLHPRTLQRRLQAEGKNASTLIAELRHQLACQLLRQSDLDMDSIAIKLGFTERRSFTYAFQQWQGQSPSAFRRNTDKNAAGSGRIR